MKFKSRNKMDELIVPFFEFSLGNWTLFAIGIDVL